MNNNSAGRWALVTTASGARGYLQNVVPAAHAEPSARAALHYAVDDDAVAPLDAAPLTGPVHATDAALIEVRPPAASSRGRAHQLAYLRALSLRSRLIAVGWSAAQIAIRLPNDGEANSADISILRQGLACAF